MAAIPRITMTDLAMSNLAAERDYSQWVDRQTDRHSSCQLEKTPTKVDVARGLSDAEEQAWGERRKWGNRPSWSNGPDWAKTWGSFIERIESNKKPNKEITVDSAGIGSLELSVEMPPVNPLDSPSFARIDCGSGDVVSYGTITGTTTRNNIVYDESYRSPSGFTTEGPVYDQVPKTPERKLTVKNLISYFYQRR